MLNMLLFSLLVWQGAGHGDFIIITHPDTAISQISKRQLRALYLAKVNRIGKVKLTPIQLPGANNHQQRFEMFLFGSKFDRTTYWYEQKIRGGARPPLAVGDEAFLLVYVARNRGYLSFLPADMLDEAKQFGLKVLLLK